MQLFKKFFLRSREVWILLYMIQIIKYFITIHQMHINHKLKQYKEIKI